MFNVCFSVPWAASQYGTLAPWWSWCYGKYDDNLLSPSFQANNDYAGNNSRRITAILLTDSKLPAGYGPIFYLHHVNIDRILAFWEYIYNECWTDDGYIDKNANLSPSVGFIRTCAVKLAEPFYVTLIVEKDGTWDVDDNHAITQTSELKPFRRGSGDRRYWTPKDTRFLREELPIRTLKGAVLGFIWWWWNWCRNSGYTYPAIGGMCIDNPPPINVKQREKYKEVLQNHFGLVLPKSATLREGPIIKHPLFKAPIHNDTLLSGIRW